MTLIDEIEKHQAFIDAIQDYVDECLDNNVSVKEIETSILNIVRGQISNRENKN